MFLAPMRELLRTLFGIELNCERGKYLFAASVCVSRAHFIRVCVIVRSCTVQKHARTQTRSPSRTRTRALHLDWCARTAITSETS